MFVIAGAPLDEVWGTQKKSAKPFKPTRRANTGPTKVYDDIIDAYIDDFQPSGHAPEISMPSKYQSKSKNTQDMYTPRAKSFSNNESTHRSTNHCGENVEPILSSDYAEDAMEYQRFFKDDNMFIASEQDSNSAHAYGEDMVSNTHVHYPQQEVQQYTPHSANNFLEPLPLTSQNTSAHFIELFMYVVSGVILIFILEQILHLGLYLR